MLRIRVRFPLGAYHARSASNEAEWPPSPLRLIGALLAAAHERPGAEPEADRGLLQRLCEAPAPLVIAPDSVAVGEPAEDGQAVRLRGASRWAPRNYFSGPVSPRNLGGERAEGSKVGVAIGERHVMVEWPDLQLDEEELERLSILASEITFLGTTRSPAVVDLQTVPQSEQDDGQGQETWVPSAGERVGMDVALRVPDANAIAAFDRRQQARRSRKDAVEKLGMVPEIAIGALMPYTSARRLRAAAEPFDPRWWGQMIVLEIDRREIEGRRTELLPKAPGSYLLARALRVALLGSFEEAGAAGEAPPILRGHGSDPHCAIVPLPHVWGEHADGCIRGVALIPPHAAREPDVHAQIASLTLGLRRCAGSEPGIPARHVKVPGAGRIWMKLPDAGAARFVSHYEPLYLGPSRRWVTITPIVHSRWRKGGADALLDQVSADCEHVGLRAPVEVEVLRSPARRGGADRVLAPPAMPESWRGLLQGPRSHLRITFPEPVLGPVLIGRARHFGLGLCVPDDRAEKAGTST